MNGQGPEGLPEPGARTELLLWLKRGIAAANCAGAAADLASERSTTNAPTEAGRGAAQYSLRSELRQTIAVGSGDPRRDLLRELAEPAGDAARELLSSHSWTEPDADRLSGRKQQQPDPALGRHNRCHYKGGLSLPEHLSPNLRLTELRLTELRLTELRLTELRLTELRLAKLRLAELRLTELRLTELRLTELRLGLLERNRSRSYSHQRESAELQLADPHAGWLPELTENVAVESLRAEWLSAVAARAQLRSSEHFTPPGLDMSLLSLASMVLVA
ncbi:MAG: hypothetical protein ACREOC_02410 [Gemmatimonadales bacterium]